MENKLVQFSRKKDALQMAVTAEARQRLSLMMERYPRGLPKKAIFPRIAARLRMSVRRVETIWHGTAKITADEMDLLRAASAASEETHADKLERAIRTLEAVDADFYRAEIDRLRVVVCQLRGLVVR